MRRLVVIASVLAVFAVAAFFILPGLSTAKPETNYRLAKSERGDIVANVNATGTINPTTTVIVGSQLSGQVVEILADYNSQVKAGDLVARLNSDQIRAKLDAARADLEQMRSTRLVQEAQIERVKAEIERARALQTDAEAQIARNETLLADLQRAADRQSELKSRGIASEAAFLTARTQRDAQKSALDSARAQLASQKAQQLGLAADLKVAEAQLVGVTAQIAQREAAVRQIEVDLRNTEIRSPVSGVVVQRNVELGATVAASLQAPTLFLIADDLRRMEIAANIDEADIGRVRAGQKVSFTVNAFPGRTFEGTVKQVRLGSQTVQNVVIYTTIISVDNARLELLPGMTANLRIETERREDVVRVPNAALRWRPASEAANTVGAAAPDGAQQRAGGAGAGGGRMFAELRAALREELKLTSEQDKEVEAAMAAARADSGALFTGGAEGGDRRERLRAIRAAMDTRIAAILTAEQKPAYEAIRQRFADQRSARSGQAGRVYVVGGDGKPLAVSVRLGATDGGVTELVAGLEAGREVITGGGPRTAEGTPARPARFGL